MDTIDNIEDSIKSAYIENEAPIDLTMKSKSKSPVNNI